MACADVDMNIHGAAEEPGGADRREAPKIWCYRPSEVIPERRGPLHDLLQKQPAAFGVRTHTFSLFLLALVAQSQKYKDGNTGTCSDLSACGVCFRASTKIKKPQSL